MVTENQFSGQNESDDMGQILDAKGLKCPLPVLKAKKVLKKVPSGETLTVEATDPSAPKDFEEFCKATGDTLEGVEERDAVFVIQVRKS